MQIFIKEIKYNIRTAFNYLLASVILLAIGGVVFRYLILNNTNISELFYIVPDALALLLGFNLNEGLASAEGFLSSLLLLPMYILTFLAGILGVHIINREKQSHTVSFIYSRPLPRYMVLVYKIAAAFIICLALTLISYLPLGLLFEPAIINAYAANFIFSNILLQLLFFSIGVLIATAFKNAYNSSLYIGWLMLILIALSRLLAMLSIEGGLLILSPFSYFIPEAYILGDGNGAIGYVLTIIGIAACLAGSFLLTIKRDLPEVE